MSRFGWAYVNDVITGSGGSTTPGGSNKTIQFASGSTFSGSTNFTFDYNTNTVRLTGTLYADSLIVSSSVIYTSGSTKFGDDVGDTHQFTGSLYNTTLISGTIARFTTISGSVVSASTYYGLPTTSTTPGGSNTSIQFNSGSTFSGSSNLTYNYTTNNVSLTGALLMSGTSYISGVDYIDFDTSASAPTWKNGRVYWNNTDGCLDVYNAEADVTLQVGQENWTRIYNDSGVILTNGTAVRLNGTHGDVPTAVKAQSLLVSGSVNIFNQILGLATHDIEVNTFGYITTQGLVRGLNTSAFNDGDMLFVSSSAGLITNIPPTAPYEIIPIGVCVKASPGTSGIIYVAVQQPTDFSDLSSVYVSGAYHYGDLLSYVSSSNRGYWTHTNQLSGAYGITGSLAINGPLSSSNNINGSGLQITGGAQFGSSISVTGTVSSSASLQTGGSGQFGSNITSNGLISSSVGFQTAGPITAGASITGKNGLIITGSAIIAGGNLSVTGSVFANGYVGDGNGITGINGANVNGVGNDWTLQFKNGATGTLTGSSNLVFTGSNLNVIGTVNAITSSFNSLQGQVTGTLVLDSIVSWNFANKQFQNSTVYTVGAAGSQAIVSASSGLVISGATNLGTVYERLLLTSSIPATVNFDTSNQSTLYVNNPPANFTLNFTNVSTTDSRVSTFNVIISQSATPFSASSVQVNTTASTVKWANSTTPTGNANKHDVYGFSLIRSGSTWVTLGQLSTYG